MTIVEITVGDSTAIISWPTDNDLAQTGMNPWRKVRALLAEPIPISCSTDKDPLGPKTEPLSICASATANPEYNISPIRRVYSYYIFFLNGKF